MPDWMREKHNIHTTLANFEHRKIKKLNLWKWCPLCPFHHPLFWGRRLWRQLVPWWRQMLLYARRSCVGVPPSWSWISPSASCSQSNPQGWTCKSVNRKWHVFIYPKTQVEHSRTPNTHVNTLYKIVATILVSLLNSGGKTFTVRKWWKQREGFS